LQLSGVWSVSEPIKHHYLPVFYLNRWRNAEGRVIRYYRPQPHKAVVASPITPDNTGYERFLYTLHGNPPGEEQVIEKDFMARRVDEPASRAIEILIERDGSRVTEEIRIAWTLFLMAMRLRDPRSLDELTTMALNILKKNLLSDTEEYLAMKREGDPSNGYEWLEKNAPHFLPNIGKIFLSGLIDNEKLGDQIINMRWAVRDLRGSSLTLLTGDRPFIATHGLADPRCMLAFPLSPEFLFIATNNQERRQELLSLPMTRITRGANALIVGQATKSVYGRSTTALRFVESRLRR
jgi:hypothetical protein